MADSTPGAARTGAALASFSRVWAQASGGLLLLVSSAILSPTDFGQFVLAASIYSVLAIFAGQGVYEYVLREHKSATAPMTAAALNLATASGACVAIFGISAFIDQAFHSTHVGALMRLLAPALLLQAENLVLEAVLLRRGRVTRVASVMIASDTFGLAVALGALWMGAGPAALALQRIGREAALLCGYAFADKWGARSHFSAAEAPIMARFAAGIIGARLLGQGASTSIDVTIGVVLSPAAAGLFRLANRLLGMAYDILNYPMRTLMWVRLPPLQHDDQRFAQTIMQMAATYGVATCALIAGIASISSAVFPLVFKPEWQAAWPVVAILAISRILSWPGSLIESLLAIRGNIRLLIIWDIANFALGLGSLLLCAPLGLAWAAASQALAALISQVFTVPIVARECRAPLTDWLGLIFRVMGAGLIMSAAVWGWLAVAPHFNLMGWPRLLSAVALGAVVYITAAARLTPDGAAVYFAVAKSALAKARGV